MDSRSDRLLNRTLATLKPGMAQACIDLLYRVPGFTDVTDACPVCATPADTVEFRTRHTPLLRCLACGHVFSRKNPGRLILHLMYRDLDYWVRDKQHQGITQISAGDQWNGFLEARMKAMENAGALAGGPRKVFEIGCSEGILLWQLARLGHTAAGCECNVPTAEEGRRALGADIRIGMFEDLDLPRNHYDVVASFHTIEHIPDLRRTFSRICDILGPEGILLIEVPTGPEEYSNPDHVQFFSEQSLLRLLELHFEQGEVVPNHYSTAEGTVVGSLYGIGRRPRRPAS